MPCAECRELSTHVFRSPDDLIHALRLSAEETNRGVLARIGAEEPAGVAEREALYSALESGSLPGAVTYRFRCEVCGDRFTLSADMRAGTGSWTREEKPDAA